MIRPGTDAVAADWHSAAILNKIFERQVAQTPGAVALSIQGQTDITYSELDQRANALAERLWLAGVAPRTHVALLARSGHHHVVGMLAALKCGAAFVTLDVDEPAPRQNQIVADLAPSALLYAPAFEGAANQLGQGCVWLEIGTADRRDATPAKPPGIEVSPGDPAFVAYTSGSTGHPKGIVQSHRSFAQFLHWFGTTFSFGPGTRLAQWAAPTYDAAYCEILGGLLFGAAVCPVPPHARNDPVTFLRWAKLSRITVLETVPSYAARLLPEMEGTNTQTWEDLRYVLLAGEELTVQLAGGLKQVLPPDVDIYNLYGPSECVLATYHRVTPADLLAQSIPIGRAIDGRELVVVDQAGASCEPGVTGEIRVRSEFLADGYLHDEARTAHVFIDINNAQSASARRELRTGDLGRWRASGELEWLGRRDNMVKRSGVRIELEEVERRLRILPEVSECAVAAINPSASPGQTRLLAYIVPATETDLLTRPDGSQVIRRRATTVLPTQLIPDEFILSSSLPKLPNGKLDRGTLTSIAVQKPGKHVNASGALSPREDQLLHIFSEVLGMRDIGADDDFFNLGGHSLLAMTVLDRIRATTGADLPMRAIFQQPTIRQLAALIDSGNSTLTTISAGTAPQPRRRQFPLTPGQEAFWIADRMLQGNPAYNVSLITSIKGELDIGALEQSLSALIARHDILRASYRFNGEAPVHVIGNGANSALHKIDLTDCPAEMKDPAAEAAVRQVAEAPFDLEQGGLIRFALVALGEEDHVLVVALHHIICDAQSVHVLASEIAALYHAAEGTGAVLSSPDLQFEQFVAQRLQLAAEAATAPPGAKTVSPSLLRRAVQRTPARRVRGVLSPRQTREVRTLASRMGTTLFSTLLACFGALLLRDQFQQLPLVVDIPVSRRRGEFSQCVGCFVETAQLRFASASSPTFRRVAKDTHDQLGVIESTVAHGRPSNNSYALFDMIGEVPFVQLADLVCAPYHLDRNTAKAGLGIYWRDEGTVLSYTIEYATDIHEPSDIDSLIASYVNLIEQVCSDPDLVPIKSKS